MPLITGSASGQSWFLPVEEVRQEQVRHPVKCAAEGTLAEIGKRYSSIELQHKAMEWREA
jgi:hypothetical protein